MLTGEMAQLASVVIVLVVVGLNVLAAFTAGRGRGRSGNGVSRFLRGMIFTIIFLPLGLRLLNLPTQSTALLWPVLIAGVLVLSTRQAVAGALSGPVKKPVVKPGSSPVPSTPVSGSASAEPYPWLESELQAPGVGTTDRAIARLPLPFHKAGHPPLESAVADAWFERQEVRLGRSLQGKELAAARLRLSTVKSMLLLGYLSVSEADKDVDVVIREGRRP